MYQVGIQSIWKGRVHLESLQGAWAVTQQSRLGEMLCCAEWCPRVVKYLIANSVVEMRNEHLFGWQFPLFTVEFRVPYAEEEKKYHLLSISSCQTLHKIHFT